MALPLRHAARNARCQVITTERTVTGWIARLADMPGVYREGKTEEEARQALEAWLSEVRNG